MYYPYHLLLKDVENILKESLTDFQKTRKILELFIDNIHIEKQEEKTYKIEFNDIKFVKMLDNI